MKRARTPRSYADIAHLPPLTFEQCGEAVDRVQISRLFGKGPRWLERVLAKDRVTGIKVFPEQVAPGRWRKEHIQKLMDSGVLGVADDPRPSRRSVGSGTTKSQPVCSHV